MFELGNQFFSGAFSQSIGKIEGSTKFSNAAFEFEDAAGNGKALGGGNGKGPVIVGETMKRIETAAEKYTNAIILNDMPEYWNMGLKDYEVTSKMMGYNRKWILEQLRSGSEIIDIGLDPNRIIPSIFYKMEGNMIKNYQMLHPEWNMLTKLP